MTSNLIFYFRSTAKGFRKGDCMHLPGDQLWWADKESMYQLMMARSWLHNYVSLIVTSNYFPSYNFMHIALKFT